MDEEYDECCNDSTSNNISLLAEHNMSIIICGDIDFHEYFGKDNQPEIEKTFCEMIAFYEKEEEYEKCNIVLTELRRVRGE